MKKSAIFEIIVIFFIFSNLVSLPFFKKTTFVWAENQQTNPYLLDPKSLLIPKPYFQKKNDKDLRGNTEKHSGNKKENPPFSSEISQNQETLLQTPKNPPPSNLDEEFEKFLIPPEENQEELPITEDSRLQENQEEFPIIENGRLQENQVNIPSNEMLFTPEDTGEPFIETQAEPPPPPPLTRPRLPVLVPDRDEPASTAPVSSSEENSSEFTPEEDINAIRLTQGDINFTNVGIIEYIRFLSKISGKNFIFDEENLQFNITVVSEEPTTIDHLIAALLQELQIRNLSLLEIGNTIVIHPNPDVRSPGKVITQQNQKGNSDIVTRVFRLNTLDPEKTLSIIRPLLSKSSIVNVLEDSNNLIITDLAINVEKIDELIRALDSPIGGVEVGRYVAQSSLAESLLDVAQQIITPIAQGNPFTLVLHSQTNSIFVISNPFLVERALILLRYLDKQERRPNVFEQQQQQITPGQTGPGATGPTEQVSETQLPSQADQDYRRNLIEQGYQIGPNGELIPPGISLSPQTRFAQGLPTGHIGRTMFFIYKLKYRNGDQIVQALKQIATSLAATGITNEDLVGAINSIQWIEASNSLIFTGSPDALERIKELINEIDIPLRQVFIEILLLDTTIRDSLTYGVDWATRFGGGNTAGGQAFLDAGSTLPDAVDTTEAGSTPDGSNLARLQGYRVGIVGRNLTKNGLFFQSIGALVTAIHTDSRQNIIMNPKILTEDNHTAELFVGSQQRLKTQSISNDQGSVLTNNFETIEVGTTIKITPLISPNDIITLDIEQENTNDVPNANQERSQSEIDINLVPITTKSKTTTRVHVPNKYFLVLSGMISEDHQRVGNRVPCLGGLPILGAGFKDKIIQDTKRNLMIFIRPEIIDTDEEYRKITERNQGIFDEKSKYHRSWNYEINEALDLFNLKRTDANERCSIFKELDCQTACPPY